MDIGDELIELRIELGSKCDGFSPEVACKNTSLSTKNKILFLLQNKDLTPCELIDTLCIAKSNVASILKSMINDGLVDSYKNMSNSKNIYYKITDAGYKELKAYKDDMVSVFSTRCCCQTEQLKDEIHTILQLLKGVKND